VSAIVGPVVNRDAVEGVRREVGHLRSTWYDLGTAAGSRDVGLCRIVLDPRGWSTPAHVHAAEEETFFVLAGDGLLWQDGETFAVGPGDCIVHRPGSAAHTLRGGADGLDVLAYGQRREAGLAHLPRAGVSWASPSWVKAPGGLHPWAQEAEAGAPECPPPAAERPANVVRLEDAASDFGGAVRNLGRSAGADRTGLNHVTLAPGADGAPAHCHSAEEELFVVLDGDGELALHPRGGGEPERHPLRAGDVVSRSAGSGVSHAFRAGASGLTYLAYGTREPGDMTYYPAMGVVALRGLGVRLRVDPA
jgi:uncharacterized cupin superfamily protein